ncbi:MAG: hypothetical protein Q9216_006486 [Gyalolechia sp. 2 TL-2023]
MILGQISYLDCFIFLVFLAPQLLLHVNIFQLLACVLKAIPFVLFQLPYQLCYERYFIRKPERSPFVQHASIFQDLVIRIVRYAFAFIPAKIGRVFFSKGVALPFLRFRMLRHGFLHSPLTWREVTLRAPYKPKTVGLWVTVEESERPDLVIYYCHGGGFSMGSSYFYLEFLLAWLTFLREAGYRNPAIFALEYTLVPDEKYPSQLEQTIAGYDHVCHITKDPSRICLAGDSAGATLQLSLLLRISKSSDPGKRRPGFATLISPWATLVTPKNRDTPSDYLNADSLHLYGRQYAGTPANLKDPLVSPGVCKDRDWWARASPSGGFCFMYGSEEVFGPEVRDLIAFLRRSGCAVRVREEPGQVHAWPVVSLFLADKQAERTKGLKDLTKMIRQVIDPDLAQIDGIPLDT